MEAKVGDVEDEMEFDHNKRVLAQHLQGTLFSTLIFFVDRRD